MPQRYLFPLMKQRVAVTLGAVLVTAAVRYGLTPWLGNDAPFLLFTLPVMGLAIFAGTLPAVVAIALSVVAGAMFASIGGPVESNRLQAVLFLIVAGGIVWLAKRFRLSLENLEAADRHLRSILETVPDGIIVMGSDSRIISFSPAAEQMFGTHEAAVISKPFGDLISEPRYFHPRQHIAEFLRAQSNPATQSNQGALMLGLHANGMSFPIELSVGEAISDGRNIYTGFVRDLTVQRDTATRISMMQARLDQVGRLGAMGAMASTLAHELNQPITAAAAYLRAVRLQLDQRKPAAEIDQTLEGAERETLRAGDIIRQLRSYVARGEVDQAVEPLPPLLREAVTLGLADGRAADVTIDYNLDPAADKVFANRVQLQQALINLIRNAVEAMEAAPKRRLTLSTKVQPDGRVRITVGDTGPGIDPDVASRLFEAFATTKSTGLGLGLPISRTIIEANGGIIAATPAPEQGSEFHITLAMSDTRTRTDGAHAPAQVPVS